MTREGLDGVVNQRVSHNVKGYSSDTDWTLLNQPVSTPMQQIKNLKKPQSRPGFTRLTVYDPCERVPVAAGRQRNE